MTYSYTSSILKLRLVAAHKTLIGGFIMYLEGFEQWYKMNKNLSTPVSDLSKATTEIFKRITEQNLEIIGENYSRFSEQLRRLSTIRKPEDLLNFQRDCLNENWTAALKNSQRLMHLTLENFEELSRLYGASAVKVTEKAVDKAQKFARKAEKETR